jgi:hypothetical protein
MKGDATDSQRNWWQSDPELQPFIARYQMHIFTAQRSSAVHLKRVCGTLCQSGLRTQRNQNDAGGEPTQICDYHKCPFRRQVDKLFYIGVSKMIAIF